MTPRDTPRHLRLVRPDDNAPAPSRRAGDRRANTTTQKNLRRPAPERRTPSHISDPKPLTATDPRWVMAVRVAEAMDPGGILPADRRERLTRIGKMMGLTPFDVSLIIAIIQDQIRSGYPLAEAPAAGAHQLKIILLKKANKPSSLSRWLPAIIVTTAILTAEAALLIAWWS